MAKLVWSRNMTRDRLHESEDKRKDLVDFYDYDELLETLDDDQVDDLIDSDERMPAMDNAYYDEDVRPKIEAQTLDGIVLLVERPEEEEPKEEEPEEEPEVEESLNESEDEESEEEEVDDELPELEGMAILADEIPEEFPDAKIVDDGEGFVLEDGDKTYDMYAIPEDKVEEFMYKCMDDPMEDVMDEDEEFESDMDLDVDSINDNCDFSKVPEVCERIVGEPEEETEEEPEEDEEELEEAAVTSEDSDNIEAEVEKVNKSVEEYGIDYFTAMPFCNYDNDPISFEHQFPNLAKLWRAFFKEVLEITDDDEIDEIWDTDIDQTDWNTVMKAASRLATNARDKGKVYTQMGNEFAAVKNAENKDESLEESAHPFADDSLKEGLEDIPFVERVNYDNGRSNGLPGIRNVNKLVAELDRIASEVGPEFKVRTTRFGTGVSSGDLKDAWMSLKKAGWSVSEQTDDSMGGFNRVYVCSKLNESLDESITITEADDMYDYSDRDPFDIEMAKRDIDEFLEDEITPEAFSDFDNDDRELGKEEWIRQMIEYNFDMEDNLADDWYDKYNPDMVQEVVSEVDDYYNKKATAMLSKIWDSHVGANEDFMVDSEPSAESVDPDDNLTEGADRIDMMTKAKKYIQDLIDDGESDTSYIVYKTIDRLYDDGIMDQFEDQMAEIEQQLNEIAEEEWLRKENPKLPQDTYDPEYEGLTEAYEGSWVSYNTPKGISYGQVISKDKDTYTVLPEDGRFTKVGASSIRESFSTKPGMEDSYTDFDDVDRKVEERRDKVHNAYYNRMRAQDEEFDEYNTPIDENVLNGVSRDYGYDVGRLRDELKNKKPLEEDEGEDVVDSAADAVGAEEVIKPTDNKGEIYKALDKSLKTAKTKLALIAKRKERSGNDNIRAEDFPNVLFIGGAGVGKTAQIKAWAKDNGINLFILQGSSLDAADMGGLPYIENGEGQKVLRAQKVGTGILDQLDRPNSVLFLDELNRARQDVRAALLQLINEHIVQDFTEDGGMRYFPNFLFTVAAINPSGKAGYQTFELDPAEKGRFRNMNVGVENDVTMNYLVKKFSEEAKDLEDVDSEAAYACLGKAQLAKAIVGNRGFDFDSPDTAEENEDNDDWNGLETTPRNLTLLLDNSDGTKDDVLSMWNQYCNNLQLPLVKRVLANYKDVENKANSVFKQGTDSDLLNKRKGGGMDRLRNRYGA